MDSLRNDIIELFNKGYNCVDICKKLDQPISSVAIIYDELEEEAVSFSHYVGNVKTGNGYFRYAKEEEYPFFYLQDESYKGEEDRRYNWDKLGKEANRELDRVRIHSHVYDEEGNRKTVSKSLYNISFDFLGYDRIEIPDIETGTRRRINESNEDFVLRTYKGLLTKKQLAYVYNDTDTRDKRKWFKQELRKKYENLIDLNDIKGDDRMDYLTNLYKQFEEASHDNDAFINFVLDNYNEEFMYSIMYSDEVPVKVRKAFNTQHRGRSRCHAIKVKYLNYVYEALDKYFNIHIGGGTK
jgi:hypothetical protein